MNLFSFLFFSNQRYYWIDTFQSRRRGPKRPSCVHVACVTIHELRGMRFERPRTERLAPDRAIRFIRPIAFEITGLCEQTPRNIAGMSIFASMTKLRSTIRKCTIIPILCALYVCVRARTSLCDVSPRMRYLNQSTWRFTSRGTQRVCWNEKKRDWGSKWY